jgi:HD-GYP domain-containing protein (c-di-GMP phosphodiesterase class II)
MTTSVEDKPIVQAPAVAGYNDVSPHLIKIMGGCRCNIYRGVSWSATPALYCAANVPLSESQCDELSREENLFLYVKQTDYLRLQDDLRDNLDTISAREDIPVDDRYNLVQSVVNTEMKRVFSLVQLGEIVTDVHRLGSNITHLAFSGNAVPESLMGIARHSTETFKHLINVAAYCVMIAESIGINDQQQLQQIATGGLLHDIGKRSMPLRLLNKVTAFNESEKRMIHMHPQKGYEELCRFESISFEQLMMVYQHHERMDGKGYPVHITGKEMHLWARICAIADVFEALTGKHAYHKPEPISRTLEHLRESNGTHFDQEIVECWSASILKK